jgi:mannose-6-phosphate isomerase-like protein (cupin superfamily)
MTAPLFTDEQKGVPMARLILNPSTVEAAGNIPKLIDEFVGLVNSGTDTVSIARMKSPPDWEEPGQTPDFDEYTVVLTGSLHVETREGSFEVGAGQAFMAARGEWVRYSSPAAGGAEYISVCLPAFSPDRAHRDE